MKTISLYTECLSFEQLQSYAASPNNEQHAQLYLHISSCELCSCAVNGFTATPFISDDLVAIHHEIDKKTIAPQSNLLTFAQACIVAVSLVSVFCFYNFTNSFSKKTNAFPLKQQSKLLVSMPKEKRQPEFSNTGATVKTSLTKPLKKQELAQAARMLMPVEKMQSIDLRLPEVAAESSVSESALATANTDVIYIYDLKVADYSRLYFNIAFGETVLHNHTPSFKENKESASDLSEPTGIDAHNILKRGLYHFNRGHYHEALAQFKLLLENNPEDVNALFYSGASLYLTGKPLQAIEKLEAVLQNPDNTFSQEAQWKLALSHLKAGNKQASKQLFTDIAAEKGLYSKQAEEWLKGL